MTDFTVTGIRYQMGDNLSFEQRNDAAVRFVDSLQIGQPVQLAFEPDNPASPDKAIAVYIDYERIGYIADEECCQVNTKRTVPFVFILGNLKGAACCDSTRRLFLFIYLRK